jgi:hypothetical protein
MGSRSKTAAKHWRQWTEEQGRAALDELARSGTSATAFARSKGISARRLAYWKKRLGDAAPPAFVAVALPREPMSPRGIEIVVGSLVVRLQDDVDADRIAQIVHALSRRLTC